MPSNGLLIVRQKKHEWFGAFAGMPAEKLNIRTGKTWGSKFLQTWDLGRLTAWIEAQVNTVGWTIDAQEPNPLDVVANEEVGVVSGTKVHTIRVVCAGRQNHAYPVQDER